MAHLGDGSDIIDGGEGSVGQVGSDTVDYSEVNNGVVTGSQVNINVNLADGTGSMFKQKYTREMELIKEQHK